MNINLSNDVKQQIVTQLGKTGKANFMYKIDGEEKQFYLYEYAFEVNQNEDLFLTGNRIKELKKEIDEEVLDTLGSMCPYNIVARTKGYLIKENGKAICIFHNGYEKEFPKSLLNNVEEWDIYLTHAKKKEKKNKEK